MKEYQVGALMKKKKRTNKKKHNRDILVTKTFGESRNLVIKGLTRLQPYRRG